MASECGDPPGTAGGNAKQAASMSSSGVFKTGRECILLLMSASVFCFAVDIGNIFYPLY
jgi:hypothetical protein